MLTRARSLLDHVRVTTSAVLALGLSSGCATQAVRLYEGPKLADEAVAVLKWDGWNTFVFQIDGKAVDSGARRAEFLPGQHTVVYGEAGGSLMPFGSPIRPGPLTAVLSLQAGRTYVVSGERRGRLRSPYLYLWIEDSASGEVLHGERPPR